MAKIDSQVSRATVFADDEPAEQFFRPAPSSTARVKQDTGRTGTRTRAAQAAGDDLDNEEDGFLRARRRVPVRRGLIPPTRVGRIVAAVAAVAAVEEAGLETELDAGWTMGWTPGSCIMACLDSSAAFMDWLCAALPIFRASFPSPLFWR